MVCSVPTTANVFAKLVPIQDSSNTATIPAEDDNDYHRLSLSMREKPAYFPCRQIYPLRQVGCRRRSPGQERGGRTRIRL
jgi:hypothetical protein